MSEDDFYKSFTGPHIPWTCPYDACKSERENLRRALTAVQDELTNADADWPPEATEAQMVARVLRELAATRAELERWRHDVTIEGDYVCPDSLALAEWKAKCHKAWSDLDGLPMGVGLRIRADTAERELAEARELLERWLKWTPAVSAKAGDVWNETRAFLAGRPAPAAHISPELRASRRLPHIDGRPRADPRPAYPGPEEVERLRAKLRADPRSAPAECYCAAGGHDPDCERGLPAGPTRTDPRGES